MTVDEVVWFANHKYGECAYTIERDNKLYIFTNKSIIQREKKQVNNKKYSNILQKIKVRLKKIRLTQQYQ